MIIDIHTHQNDSNCFLSIKSVSIGSKSKFCAKYFSAGILPWFVNNDIDDFMFFELVNISKMPNL
jgi:hypothetical protein